MRLLGKLSLLLLVLISSHVFGDKESIAKDLMNAKKAFEPSKQLSSFKKLTTSLSVATHLAGAVFHLVSLIKTFTGDNESDELKFLKDQFNVVNTKMDALDYDFSEVKDLIDWSVVRVNFGEYERRIKATDRILQDYIESPLGVRNIFEDIFVRNFEMHNADAALKMYNGLVNENRVFGENLFAVARRFYQNDRLKVAEFGAYVCRIIQRGLNHEAAYFLFKKQEGRLDDFTERWEARFQVLKKFAAKIDEEIVSTWPQQFRLDVDKMIVRTAAGLSPSKLANNVYNMLDNKFPWRAWVVVVFPYREADDDEWKVESCGNNKYERHNVGGKTVFINSGDAAAPPSQPAKAVLNQLPSIYTRTTVRSIRKASYVFDMINSRSCSSHKLRAVFENSVSPAAIGPDKHFATKRIEVHQKMRQGQNGMIYTYKKTFWMILAR